MIRAPPSAVGYRHHQQYSVIGLNSPIFATFVLALDALLERIVALCHDVRLSVCPSVTSVHCDHTVHVSADLSL